MPHFSATGHDMVLCQKCGHDIDTGKEVPTWVKGTGNVCATCIAPAPQSLHDYCRTESGGLTGAALDRYINRYYGHN